MSIEKFYILKNSATKDNCADCRSIANQVYQGSKLPKLPIHPNCACSMKEIPTLVLPTMKTPSGDAAEFGVSSDTYKSVKDLGERWMATEDQEERDRFHELAEKARRLAREGTPLKYGQDVIMETLHANVNQAKKLIRDMKSIGFYTIDVFMYPWFIGMTCSEWDYKYNPDWQVPYPIFDDVEMNKLYDDGSYAKNWTPWIYFNGEIVSADKFGNINLGYVGTKLGYLKSMLKIPYITNDKGDGPYIDFGIDMAKQGK